MEESWLAHEQYRYLAVIPAYAQAIFLIFRGLWKKTLALATLYLPLALIEVEAIAVVEE